MASVSPYPLPGERSDRPSRWRVYYIDSDGKRVCRSFRGRDGKGCGKREAERWAEEQEAAARAGKGTQKPSSQTVREYLAEWLPGHVARENLKPRAIESHIFVADAYILPFLGDTSLQRLTPVVLDDWQNRLLTEPRPSGRVLAAATVVKTRSTLNLALAHAVVTGRLSSNPLDRVRRPRMRAKPAQPLTPDEIRAILAQVGTCRLGPLFLLCLHLGLRIGEALALRWADVRDGVLYVRQTASEPHVSMRRADLPAAVARWTGASAPPTSAARLTYHTPKTAAAVRSWPIPRATLEVLRRWQETQNSERQVGAWVDTGLIFTTPTGAPVTYTSAGRAWKSLLRRAGVPPRGLHAERHTAASRALEGGLSLVETATMLGHANPSITMHTYAHLLDPERAAAAAKMDALLDADPAPYAQSYAESRVKERIRRDAGAENGRGETPGTLEADTLHDIRVRNRG